jgi:hypothetical protein
MACTTKKARESFDRDEGSRRDILGGREELRHSAHMCLQGPSKK